MPPRSLLFLIPLYTVVKRHATASEYIQRRANGQVDLACTQTLDELQISQVAAAARIGDGDGAPFGQRGDEVVVDAALQALDVGGVDQKL